jgi:hypothetical protein
MNERNLSTLMVPILCTVVASLLGAPAALAQTPGPPSGNGVQPVLVTGNPNCTQTLGYDFGWKPQPEPPPSGSYAFPDGINTFDLTSDGSYFDWTSTLGLDAVIVKAGPNANVYTYAPESTGDTLLHGPINPNNDQPYAISHIELCYDYEVDVAKTAETTFTRTWHWDITKGVSPAAWALFTGDTGTSRYTVMVDRTGFTDSDWAVSGTITVANNTPYDATITGVSDAVSDLLGPVAAAVDCGVTFPYALASGDELVCSYATPLSDGTDRVNTATVTTDPAGIVGGNTATADVTFGDPTTEVDAQVHVVDSNGQAWGPVADDALWMYEVTFGCDGDEGIHGNIATIVETGQSDDASVSVSCHDLTVTKDAEPDFTRTWSWTIDKTADQTELLLSPGQTFQVNYQVQVDATATDGDWTVTGGIWIANGHPSRAAMLTGVADSVSGVGATVDCPSLVVPAGGSLHCTYTAALPDGSSRTNTATATLQNLAFAFDGTAVAAGTTDFSGTFPVVFGTPGLELDECVDVEDSLGGILGTVCAASAPATFDYAYTVGPYADPDDCGENLVENTASFVTGDTGATGEDTWTVTVTVACGQGCTLTPGYWKTHSEYGPAPYDDTWAQLPAGADTPFFLSGQTFYQVLWTSPKGGNAYYILAHAYIAATLNFLDGASAPPEVMDAWNGATALFEVWTPDEVGALHGNRPPRPELLSYAGVLDMYNNGILGPGHCSEDDQSAP